MDLLGTKWQVDHIVPVIRNSNGVMTRGTLDIASNCVPSCRPCNNFKSVFTLAQFREELESQVDRARKYSVNFRMAELHGLIEIKGKPIVFYFEKEGLS